MIVPGDNYAFHVDLIDLESGTNCPDPDDFPALRGLSGAFLNGKPFACSADACFWYDKSNLWRQVTYT